MLGRGAVLLIISDGWDRGDCELLEREMAYLQRSSYRLMWLNPLEGTPGYQPIQMGMAAALQYVDDFLPGRNLASLEMLSELLSGVRLERPERKQRPRKPKLNTAKQKLICTKSRRSNSAAIWLPGSARLGRSLRFVKQLCLWVETFRMGDKVIVLT